MYQFMDDTPRLKSLNHRKWLILKFWILIVAGTLSAIFTYFMFFEDAEVFVVMILFTSNFFYRAYLHQKAFNGFEDWENFRNSKIDIDELFEIADMEEGEEKTQRNKELEIRSKEYNRLWKVTWDLKLLNRKEELYLKKVEKKKKKFEKKRNKLEQDLVPRCKGIKM